MISRRHALATLAGATLAAPLIGDEAGPDKLAPAIDRALATLAKAQVASGAWAAPNILGESPAITSLAVMALLSAGHVPGEGPYGKALTAGVSFVLRSQRANGLIAPVVGPTQVEMYTHGIATLMLAEVVGQTDVRQGKEIRERLARAVAIILQAQRTVGEHRGGWRYQVQSSDADLSVTGWQLLALRAARNIGCDVPAEPIERAIDYVKRCFDPSTAGYSYQAGGRQVTVACTGTGILCLELAGRNAHRTNEALRAGGYILKNPPRLTDAHAFYGFYYCAQAMFQLGDNYWLTFRPLLHARLLDTQAANGTWGMGTTDYVNFGSNYTTAMAVLALTVEYRLLPIYQRDEQAGTKPGAKQ
jgi:hypothetical protein